MKALKLWLFCSLLPTLSGIIISANLDVLLPSRPIEGHWWKVFLSVFLALVAWPFTVFSMFSEKEESLSYYRKRERQNGIMNSSHD